MSEPSQGTFCQICHGPWPDGHKDWCPIKTQIPVQGDPGLQQQMQSGWNPGIQNALQGVPGGQGGLLGQIGAQTDDRQRRLSAIIEHLCDHLRELRREYPAQFFDSPHEALLRNLEAGLDSFYRAKEKL
jgi:hypothetical protein